MKARRERGAAAVEFALVLPLLLIMLFAIIDFGWVLTQQLSVTAAAREGARYYAIHNLEPGAQGVAEDRATELVTGTLTFSYPSTCSASVDDDELTMVVRTPLTDLTGWLGAVTGGVMLEGTGSMRCGG
ncbi:TadE/TadG family type IV pilus assembly protein [Agromyces sp. S2-1-8]|uniref:TadE/TadG family type IV pilus assembly protein n=1 Tax=Agromyces sp. S2-1-8 TaxID=2897180 RepID=UPI001E37E312|nr:TadE family protein [Agromyces sp. S2-1-8]MCD5344953.1 pilus assembly protein [Agromyces sp. S2-1-8]